MSYVIWIWNSRHIKLNSDHMTIKFKTNYYLYYILLESIVEINQHEIDKKVYTFFVYKIT